MTEPTENSGPAADPAPSPPPAQDATPATPGLGTKAITVKPPSPEKLWVELAIALNYLTRLTIRLKDEPKPRQIRKSMGWFPVVGAVIGLFGAVIDWVMAMAGLPGLITSTFAVVGMLWATRALHEEEFASLANQYGQTIDNEKKTGWLQEERSVRYGTLAVILVIIMKIGAIASLGSDELVFSGLIVASCWSRTLMVVATSWLRPVAGDPVADYFQQPPTLSMVLALVIGIGIGYAALGTYAAAAMGISAIVALVVALIGGQKIRGYNGPLLGTLQQVVELTVLGVVLSVQ